MPGALTRQSDERCVVGDITFQILPVDLLDRDHPSIEDHVSRRQLDQVLRIHHDVDQADRRRLRGIADEAFGDEPLDLVVDDCSHLYGATKASFDELFPRLRPGGLYMIEDWDWVYQEKVAEIWADQVPLTRLIFELVLAMASAPGLISEITIESDLARDERATAVRVRVGWKQHAIEHSVPST
jgi:hypothetical protein